MRLKKMPRMTSYLLELFVSDTEDCEERHTVEIIADLPQGHLQPEPIVFEEAIHILVRALGSCNSVPVWSFITMAKENKPSPSIRGKYWMVARIP